MAGVEGFEPSSCSFGDRYFAIKLYTLATYAGIEPATYGLTVHRSTN